MKPIYSAGVVGAGMGGRLSMTGLRASARFELKAVADVRPDAREKARQDVPGIKTYASHAAMFADCPTDVVCVSTYAPSHLPIVMDALKLRSLKGILVEKPLGETAAAGRAIVARIKARKLPMAVPHNLLAAPHALDILAWVQAGRIGRFELMEVQCDKWDAFNAGIHWMDFFVHATGNEPIDFVLAAMDATTRTYRDGMQVETEAVSYVVTRSGTRAVMQTGDYVKVVRAGRDLLFRLVGTKGSIEFPGWDNACTIVDAEHPGGQTITAFRKVACTGHQRHLEWMADQMDARQPDYRIAESSLTALEICEAIYLSGKTRQKVVFPLETFKPLPVPRWNPGRPYSGRGGGRDGRKLA
jgi:predicted dehydrogenase